jgi:hypothetical protein
LSQKELQRVAVISSCVKGELTCARAAELLDLSKCEVRRFEHPREAEVIGRVIGVAMRIANSVEETDERGSKR